MLRFKRTQSVSLIHLAIWRVTCQHYDTPGGNRKHPGILSCCCRNGVFPADVTATFRISSDVDPPRVSRNRGKLRASSWLTNSLLFPRQSSVYQTCIYWVLNRYTIQFPIANSVSITIPPTSIRDPFNNCNKQTPEACYFNASGISSVNGTSRIKIASFTVPR